MALSALSVATGLSTPAAAELPGRPAQKPGRKHPGETEVEVEGVKVAPDGRRVVITTSAAPTFSLFRLTDPHRVLIDVFGAAFSGDVGEGVPVADPVRRVSTQTLAEDARPTARVELELDGPVEPSAHVSGRDIVVTLESAPGAAAAPTSDATPEPEGPPRLGRFEHDARGAGSVLRAPLSGGPLAGSAIHMQTLSSPPRLVIDLAGVDIDPKWQRVRVGAQGVRRARAATRPDGARVVLDIAGDADFPEVAVDAVGDHLEIGVRAPPRPAPEPLAEAEAEAEDAARAPQTAASETPAPEPLAEAEDAARAPQTAASGPSPSPPRAAEAVGDAAPPEAAGPTPAAGAGGKPRPQPGPAASRAAARASAAEDPAALDVENVTFEPKDGFYRLTVHLDGDASALEVARRGGASSPRLVLEGARLPQALERTMDVSGVAREALTSVASFGEKGRVVLAARIEDETEHRHWRRGSKLMWDFRSRKPRVAVYDESGTASFGATAGKLAAGQRKRYTGRRISLDLKDADIQNVLRLLADVSKLNIVASEEVTGKITIKLRNVPWDQALDIILRAKQLDKTRNGNIIRVAPISVLRKEEELRLARMEAQVKLEPLTVRLIPVSYAVAADIAPQVKDLLTERGKINIDERTNVLIVEDIPNVLTKVQRLVRTLDTQTPQVLIEARIVEARSNFSRELGIQWGGNASFSQDFGNQTGLSFPSSVRIAGGADDIQNNVTAGVLPSSNYAVNLPATVGSGGGGALGFVFGSLNSGTFLNLRLSAAEAIGKIKIVSAPKVVTLDNKEAKILSGERVPITVITANGPTTRFIDANIELRVVPHVTQDGAILMQIQARKNELSDRVDFLGVPGILTKEAETQMIVRDGDTAVLGGLYRRNTQENEAYVPWLGRIPVLGWLFKTTSRQDARDELLIFISPRIVNRSAALIAPE